MLVIVQNYFPLFVQKHIDIYTAKDKGLSKDDLYCVIFEISGKEHMTELTYVEAAKVLDRINHNKKYNRRTDEGGSQDTIALRQKIYNLTEQLGWNDNDARINGFIKKYFKVETIQWLDRSKCIKAIEMLKKMVKAKEDK